MFYTRKNSAAARIGAVLLAICCAFCAVAQPIQVHALAAETIIGGVVAAYFAATGIQLINNLLPADNIGSYLYDQFTAFCADKGQQVSDLIDVSQLLMYNGLLKIKQSISNVLQDFTGWFVTHNNVNVDTVIYNDVSTDTIVNRDGIDYTVSVRDYTGVSFDSIPLSYNLNQPIFSSSLSKSDIRISLNNSKNYYVLTDSNGTPVLYLYLFWQYLSGNPNANLYTYWSTPVQFDSGLWTIGISAESRPSHASGYNNCDFTIYTSNDRLFIKAYFNDYFLQGGGWSIPQTLPSLSSVDYQIYMFFHHSDLVSKEITATADPVYPDVGDDDYLYLQLDGVETMPTTVDDFAEQSLGRTETNTNVVSSTVAASDADVVIPESPPSIGDYDLAALGDLLTTRFPFSIPWDVKRVLDMLHADPVAPSWTVKPLDIEMMPDAVRDVEVDIDLTDSQFDGIMDIVRWGIVVLYCAGLIVATKSLIWS